MTAAFALLLPLLLSLGYWQLGRADEKQARLAASQKLQAQAPVALNAGHLATYTPVVLSGRFDRQRHFLLDNKVLEGRVGFDVVTPFYDDSGRVVLVNRGWVAGFPNRSQLPQLVTPAARVVIHGRIARNIDKPFLLAKQQPNNRWPGVYQALDLELMAQALGQHPGDYFVRLNSGAAGAYRVYYQPVTVSPARHTAYAVQWFALAVALVVLYLSFGFGSYAVKS